ncbi:hypothetical protein [Chitinophaga rhizophila]|uniref:NlpE-like protein n=1 Tax=Chitinophaga rhizophila TaxID=2866212 RepID=A0ABS7GIL7_9BACT|nr:hypothetical protein [Chitinophaga rhizophila]MBW8686624.1 hypothetical protein [Chitinophaga rhizophila]
MKPSIVITFITLLLTASSGCSKNDVEEKMTLQRGLRGKIVYSSCATSVVQVLNKPIGAAWTNCHDQQRYENIIGVGIVNRNNLAIGEEFTFNIIQLEPVVICDMADCGPLSYHTILITGN